MHWTAAVGLLRDERRAGVLVTVTDVRGHAPRDAGAKMVVAADRAWGSVGGGNLEELKMNYKVPVGVPCCSFEPIPERCACRPLYSPEAARLTRGSTWFCKCAPAFTSCTAA